MGDRRELVVLLLGSRFDGLFVPPGALRTSSGFAPGALRACPSCGDSAMPGWVVDAFKRRRPCVACGGSSEPSGKHGQWVARDGGKGRVAFDLMDAKGLPVGSASTFATARPRRTVKCDACGGEGAHGNQRRCDVCGGSGRRDQHLFELRLEGGREEAPDPLDAAIDARDASGSYHELDLALAGIVHHVNKPAQFRWLTDNAVLALRLLDEVFLPPVSRQEAELEPEERALVDLALAYVVGRMPDPIRVPADVRANVRVLAGRRTLARGRGAPRTALSQRDGEIRSLARRGRPVQWIAAEYGLGVSTVYEIVNGDAA